MNTPFGIYIGRVVRRVFAAGIFLALMPSGTAAQATLEGLGTVGEWDISVGLALSADGRTVTGNLGRSDMPNSGGVFYWTREDGMVELGTLGGEGALVVGSQSLSDDGKVVVGASLEADGEMRAFRWTEEAGMQSLGTLWEDSPFVYSAASAVSGSGHTVYGISSSETGIRGFVWTADDGMVAANFWGAASWSAVTARVNDSQYLVREETENGSRVVLLTSDSAHWLQSPEGNETVANAAGFNRAVGATITEDGIHTAVEWNLTSGTMSELPGFAGLTSSTALGISSNGAIVVGWASNETESSAVMWTPFGHYKIADFLERYYGIDLSDWDGLISASGVAEASQDRFSIVGTGLRDGREEAFLLSDLNVMQTRWLDEPAGNLWDAAGNWDNGLPFSSSDAVFGPSTVTDVSITSSVDVSTIRMLPDAPAYTFTVENGGVLSVGVFEPDLRTGLENLSAHRPQFVIESGGTLQVGFQTHFEQTDFMIRGSTSWIGMSGASESSFVIGDGGQFQAVGENVFSDSQFTIQSGGWMNVYSNATFPNSSISAQGGTFFAASDVQWSGAEMEASFGGVLRFVDGGPGDSVVNLHDGGILRLSGNSNGGDAQITLHGEGSTLLVEEGANAGRAKIAAGAGSSVLFQGGGEGRDASITIQNGATLDISSTGLGSVPVGSLEGSGLVKLGDRTLEVGALGRSTTFNGTIEGSGGALVKVGTGTLTLGGTNTYTGGTQILGGLLEIDSNARLGSGGLLIDGGGIRFGAAFNNLRTFGIGNSGATIDTNGFDVTFSHGLTGPGGVTSFGVLTKTGAGKLTLTGENIYRGGTRIEEGTIEIAGTGRFPGIGTIVNNGVIIFNRSIEYPMSTNITGTGSIIKRGSNYLRLVGNSFSGGAVLESGRVELNGTDALGTGTVILQGGTLRSFNTARTLPNAIILEGDYGVDGSLALTFEGPFTLTGNHALSITNSALTTIKGVIGESEGNVGVLRKTGAGVLRVTGANTFTGGTFVDGGTLLVDNESGSGLGSGNVFIAEGATLGGSGSFTGDVLLDGVISPGTSPGTLTTGSQTWNGGATYVWELNSATGIAGTNWDWLEVNGSLTIHSTAENPFTIAVVSLGLDNEPGDVANFDPAQTYTWILATASGGISGFSSDRFRIDSSAFSNAPDTSRFAVVQQGNSISLVYSAVPEPHEWAVAIAGLLLLLAIRRRAA